MKITKKITKPLDKITEVICDICGNSCNAGMNNEYLSMETHWGYESNKDTERWTAQICEECVDKHLVKLINFKIEEYL